MTAEEIMVVLYSVFLFKSGLEFNYHDFLTTGISHSRKWVLGEGNADGLCKKSLRKVDEMPIIAHLYDVAI